MWRDDAKPTRANIKKRLHAAGEALASAKALLANAPDKRAQDAIANAGAWLGEAHAALDAAKGKRTKK